MGAPIGLVVACAPPRRVGAFWRQALGYEEADPPHGYASWAEVAAAGPADGGGDGITHPPAPRAALVDGVGRGAGGLTMLTGRVDAELLAAVGPGLGVVANFAVGYDNLDL